MTRIIPNIRYALRGVRRNPLFTTVAVLSLALGIGANAAIFTLMDQIMLRKLPVTDPNRLVMLYQQGSHPGSNMGSRMHSYPIYLDYKEKAEPFADALCRRLFSTSVSIGNRTERVGAEMVSGNYFTMLGVKPAIGRLFNPEEDDGTPSGHPVAVLDYDYWVRRFARDPNIVGQKILVNNYPMTIIGVSAEGFAGLDPAQSPQIRVPILMEPVLVPEWDWFQYDDRRCRWVQVFARLKPGYTPKTAQPPLQVLFHQIREYESTLESAKDWTPYMRDRFLEGTIQVESAATGYSDIRNNFSKALVVLMSMVGLVLLIACANVANLLIARAFARQKEIAVRLSIGATRGRLVGQLLAESLVLSSIGGVVGVGVAFAMTRGLLALVPAEGNPLLIRPEPDARILLFALGVTVLTALLFGLIPALRSSRPDLASTLKDTVGAVAGARGSSLFLRKSLVAAQVALSFLLLFGAGLFARSLYNLKATDSGFRDLDNLVTFQLAPALNGYDAPRVVHFYEELLDRLRGLPGVKSAAHASVPVLHGWEWDSGVQVEGHEAADGEDMQAFMNSLSPGYFETMGVPILEGRDFDRRDIKEDSKVAIVNRHFAEHYFGDGSAVGRHMARGGHDSDLDIEIVGVAEDSLYDGPRQGVRRQMFVPNWGNDSATFYVRTTMASDAAYTAVRNAVKELDCVDAGLRDEDARPAARRDAAHRAADGAAVGGLRRAGDLAREHRALRGDGLRGGATDEGGRLAHGPRSTARSRGLAGDARGAAVGGHRARHRGSVRDAARQVGVEPALWRGGKRPVGGGDRPGAIDCGLERRRLDPRATGEPDQSDSGAALRIGRQSAASRELRRARASPARTGGGPVSSRAVPGRGQAPGALRS